MLSTTRHARGQALAVFTLALTAVVFAAALAFDAGLLYVERRDQQNAADAAAMAGAHYLTTNTSQARIDAEVAARKLATANGFTNAQDSAQVVVNIPPVNADVARRGPGYIEVEISSTRPSLFASLMGVIDWQVAARAVAYNDDGATASWSVLALRESGNPCTTLTIAGQGRVVAAGDIQVNQECEGASGAMSIGGGGEVEVTLLTGDKGSCNVHGSFVPNDWETNPAVGCNVVVGADPISDPLASIDPPTTLTVSVALAPERIAGAADVPSGCPGIEGGATLTAPSLCKFQFNNTNKDTEFWYLRSGVYPGGLELNGGTYFLEPGVFFMGGGGLEVKGEASVYTVASKPVSVTPLPAVSHGVLIYNSELPGTGPSGAAGDVRINGSGADIKVLEYQGPVEDWRGLTLWQDKNVTDEMTINGSDSYLELAGTIYAPTAEVKVNGSSPDLCPGSVEAQLIMDAIIAYEFHVTGAECSTIEALNRVENRWKAFGAGLVE